MKNKVLCQWVTGISSLISFIMFLEHFPPLLNSLATQLPDGKSHLKYTCEMIFFFFKTYLFWKDGEKECVEGGQKGQRVLSTFHTEP